MKEIRNEISWIGYYDRLGDLRYIVTSKESRDWYYLYRVKNGEFERVGRDKDPSKLARENGVGKELGITI